jgi:hypothetical protein
MVELIHIVRRQVQTFKSRVQNTSIVLRTMVGFNVAAYANPHTTTLRLTVEGIHVLQYSNPGSLYL